MKLTSRMALLLLIAVGPLAAQVDSVWTRRYDSGGYDEPNAIACDQFGNVYVTGFTQRTSRDVMTIKYGPDGTVKWTRFFDGPTANSDAGAALTVDPAGNVYVFGETYSVPNQSDLLTLKYDSSGAQQWYQTYNGTGNAYDIPRGGIVLDAAGNCYVSGSSAGTSGYAYDVAILSYTAAGAPRWTQRYANAADEHPQGIAIDPSGAVYIGGYSYSGGNNDGLLLKYTLGGAFQWARTYNNGYADMYYDVEVNPVTGDAIACGSSGVGSSDIDCFTICYTSAGALRWTQRYGPQVNYDRAWDVACDPAGNVYVAGESWGVSTNIDYATMKYTSAGTPQWVQRYVGPGSSDHQTSLAVDAAGNACVTGMSVGTAYDYATVKYNTAGVQQWVQRYNYPGANINDEARAIALDSFGNVVVTGRSYQSGHPDWCTIKYGVIDVGATAITAPAGSIDSGASVTPVCTVANFGTSHVSYPVRLKVGAFYNATAGVTSHVPGTRVAVTFPAYAAWPRGTHAVTCTTELYRDAVPANNAARGAVTVQIHDVGPTRLELPGAIDSNATVTPACSVFNHGTVADTYAVRLCIGPDYDQQVTVNAHPAATALRVTFPAWIPLTRGANAISCSTRLGTDVNHGNDKLTGSVTVQVHDVGAFGMKAPLGAVDSSATVVPVCSLYNCGTATESYTVGLRIGTGYTQTMAVTNHAAGAAALVTFPTWVAEERGNLAVVCSTELADMRATNNRHVNSVLVRVHDAAASAIAAPVGAVLPGPVTPQLTVRGAGNTRESLAVVFDITNGSYSETLALAAGIPETDTTIDFPSWTATTGHYFTRGRVLLPGDQVPNNNVVDDSFDVGVIDVGVEYSYYPTGEIDTTIEIAPRIRVKNFGDVTSSFLAFFTIYDMDELPIYSQMFPVGMLAPADTRSITFPVWAKPHYLGWYTTRAVTWLSGDGNPRNDTFEDDFQIIRPIPPADSNWTRMADLPAGPKAKNVKDGGCLAADDSSGIYALKGNNRYEFYAYNVGDNAWATKESIPAIGRAGKKKAVKKGAALAVAEGSVYAAKGNNSVEFWQYAPGTGNWTQKADIPLGAKAVREGTGAVTLAVNNTSCIYFLKGSGTAEFYRYRTGTDGWETMQGAPTGTAGKAFKNGSCLAVDEAGTTIFALKASYNELYAYDVALNTWRTKSPLPFIGSSGKKKKVKDGAGMAFHNGYVYALKGGNTFEFWRYQADSDRWQQLGDLPYGGGRKVKGGGALVYVPEVNAVFALKGNNTLEFWRYGLLTGGAPLTVDRPAVQSPVEAASRSRLGLRIAPNPTSFHAPQSALRIDYLLARAGNVSLKLYDITGKLVTTLDEGYRHAGAYTISTHRQSAAVDLAPGIYLVELETEGSSAAQKLVVR